MRLNPLSLLSRRPEPQPPVLLEVTPPRSGERTLLGVENLLAAIAVPEPFTLELAGDADGVTLMARCLDQQAVRGQLTAHYPQAVIDDVPDAEDPLRLREGEQAWSLTLRSSGPDYVPLRTYRDDDLLDPGSDPLIALLGALSAPVEGERIVAQLRMQSLGPGWAQGYAAKAFEPPLPLQQQPAAPVSQERQHANGGMAAAFLAVAVLGAVQGYRWVQAGELWKTVLAGLGIVAVLGLVGWAKARWQRNRNRIHDPALIKEKVSQRAFAAEIQVTAILPEGDGNAARKRARELLQRVATAYRHFDHPLGARFDVSRVRSVLPAPERLHPSGAGFLGARSVLGAREAACLWHPPGARDETHLVGRSGAKVLLPSPRDVRDGALVGETTAGRPQPVRFAGDLLHRHHLYVARTRMGKSTLMRHLIIHKLLEKAAGRDGDAIIVVDPHADLVADLLGHVPESLIGQVRLVDLGAEGGLPGINLLDTRVFSDRDRTADSVVRVARGLWDQWGPRMQSILEQTVKTLHEANAHPSTAADEQHTILDGLRLLSDKKFREGILDKVSDPYLLEWWARTFSNWRREYRSEAFAPVQTRLSYYASSKVARAVLGQPRSTIDLRQVIRDGGILFVSTAQGTAGKDVAALVGASLLNLVDSVIREQESLPIEQRRGALVVVDEMQSMPGVDYESMLSELGKYGASFVLATQSLAKLSDLSPSMQSTLLANVGCLAVFQAAAADAQELVLELGRDRVSLEDIVSLPVHHAYVRATVNGERVPAFSMKVREPEQGDPDTAARIRSESASYVVSPDVLAAQEAEGRRRVEEYQASLEALRKGEEPGPERGPDKGRDEGRDHPREAPRDRKRKRRRRPPEETPAEGDE
ncbi:MAG: type IV secretion system DNA-binding domain-containing protein [Chloroflexota bacterium]|nr:type IV secretion system DNA-binding domain-containing protein [Chloroflexota bacterium]